MSVVQNFPSPGAPMVDAQGRITGAYQSLLMALWRRTGSAQGATAGSGTVTSVGLASPSGDIVIGSTPVTVSGTITADLAAQAGLAAGTYNNVTLNSKGVATGASNAAYLTGNQTVTLSGDATGSGATGIAVTLATVTPGKGGTGLVTYTLGDLLYCSAANTLAKLAGNTTATPMRLVQTGTGTVSAAPAWVKDGWEYLGGAAPLGATNATLLATTTIAARDELMIVISITGYTGAATGQVQFNASATGHTYRWLTAAAGGTTFAAGTNTVTNGANVKVGPADTANPREVVLFVQNRANDATNGEKPITMQSVTGSGASGTQLAIDLFAGSFFSTSQITQVGITASANSFKAGSSVQIYGRNSTA